MIDWISAVVPCSHNLPVNDGAMLCVRADGSVQWETRRRKSVRGSFESAITVRSAQRPSDGAETAHNVYPHSHLEVSGNPAKWLQGHNLWGTDDLPGLLLDTLHELVAIPALGLTPTDDDLRAWHAGEIVLTRVDVNRSYTLGRRSDVLAWLRAAEHSARTRAGRGQLCGGSTLYLNKDSSYWTVRMYAKGQEIEVNGHGQEAISQLPSARAWADPILRTELVMKSKELRRLGLRAVTAWLPLDDVPFDAQALLSDRLGSMTMTTMRTLPDNVSSTLTTMQRFAYDSWLSGRDLRQMMSKNAFYRLRRLLLPHGIDVANVQASEDRSNVVPLVRILEAVPVGVPDWAIGTPLYYEPKRRLRVA